MFSIALLVEKFEIRMTMFSDMLMRIDVEFLFALNMALVHEIFYP